MLDASLFELKKESEKTTGDGKKTIEHELVYKPKEGDKDIYLDFMEKEGLTKKELEKFEAATNKFISQVTDDTYAVTRDYLKKNSNVGIVKTEVPFHKKGCKVETVGIRELTVNATVAKDKDGNRETKKIAKFTVGVKLTHTHVSKSILRKYGEDLRDALAGK